MQFPTSQSSIKLKAAFTTSPHGESTAGALTNEWSKLTHTHIHMKWLFIDDFMDSLKTVTDCHEVQQMHLPNLYRPIIYQQRGRSDNKPQPSVYVHTYMKIKN